MRRLKRSIGIIGALALVLSMTMVGSASAHHSPPVEDPVTACGKVVTAADLDPTGTYKLTHNVGPCTGHGLEINVSGGVTGGPAVVTIDLNGHVITGDGEAFNAAVNANGDAGILVDDETKVNITSSATVKGTVQLFNAGVALESSTEVVVENLTVVSNHGTNVSTYGDGIHVHNSDNNTIKDNVVKDNAMYSGINLYGDSDSNTIGGASGDGNDVSSNNEVNLAFVNNQQTSGIRLEFGATGECPSSNTISYNTVNDNGLDGISLFNCATGNTISNNTVNNNGHHPFLHRKGNGINLFAGANNNTISDNRPATGGSVNGNAGHGIALGFCGPRGCSWPTGNTISGNEALNNGQATGQVDLRDFSGGCTANTWGSPTANSSGSTKDPSCIS